MSAVPCDACCDMILQARIEQENYRKDLTLPPNSCPLCATIAHHSDFEIGDPFALAYFSCRLTEHSPMRAVIQMFWPGPSEGENLILLQLHAQACLWVQDLQMITDNSALTDCSLVPSLPSSRFDQNTFNLAAKKLLRVSLDNCLSDHTHSKCQELDRSISFRYPTCLINVSSSLGDRVMLENTHSQTQGPYATLSHCWGKLQSLQFNKYTERELRRGIDVGHLTKTFRQAIEVCRSLDIPYIWIDSLCICQGSEAHWHKEAALMASVYSNALLNVSATGASDGSIGLDFMRSPLVQAPFELSAPRQFWRHDNQLTPTTYTASYPFSFFADTVGGSPLDQRAWVMQESLLSRQIVHFTRTEVYWQCSSKIASEKSEEHFQHPFSPFDLVSWRRMLLQTYLTSSAQETRVSSNEIYEIWNSVCHAYSRKRLTEDSDKLVAINGIATRLASLSQDKLLCGLWERRLVPQLLWRSEDYGLYGNPPPERWRAPSWSWASINHTMTHSAHFECGRGVDRAMCEKVEFEAHASGQLKGERAALTLYGKVLEATILIVKRDKTRRYFEDHGAIICMDYSKPVSNIYLDYLVTEFEHVEVASEHFELKVLCMRVFEDSCKEKRSLFNTPWDWHTGALILQKVQGDRCEYRRIGIVLLNEEELKFYVEHESQEEKSIIII